MSTHEVRVPVELGRRSYDVVVGEGTLGRLGTTVAAAAGVADGAKIVLAADDRLPGRVRATAEASLKAASFQPIYIPVTASEMNKTLGGAEELLKRMASERIERSHALVALGGGIVGDLAGFAGAIYRRGIPVIQCPTTLLAMVDAAVGGKTGVNLGGLPNQADLIKNAIGAFHQPRAVLVDVYTLDSLPDRHFRAGLAECIKHAMVAGDWNDPDLADWTSTNTSRILSRNKEILISLIARSVRLKAAIVGKDEREELPQGGRALLNLGHTFGHAIETISALSPTANPADAPLHHGEAVSLGIVAAFRTAEAAGLCPTGLGSRAAALLSAFGLPVRVASLPPFDLLKGRMLDDKKVASGTLRLVLPTAWGRAAVFAGMPDEAIRAGWDAIRA